MLKLYRSVRLVKTWVYKFRPCHPLNWHSCNPQRHQSCRTPTTMPLMSSALTWKWSLYWKTCLKFRSWRPIFQKPPDDSWSLSALLSNNLPLPVSGLLSTTQIRTVSVSTRALLVVLVQLLLAKHRLNHQDTMAPAAADAAFLPPTLPPNLLKTSNTLGWSMLIW